VDQSQSLDNGVQHQHHDSLSDNLSVNALWLAGLFYVIDVPCHCLLAGFGMAMRGVLTAPGRLRQFNITMALLLVLSLHPVA